MPEARAWSLRTHLIVFGLLITIPLLVVAVFLAGIYVTGEQSDLREQARRLVREVRTSVDREILRYAAALNVLANSTDLEEENFQRVYKLAIAVTKAISQSSVNLKTQDGRTIFDTVNETGAVSAESGTSNLRAADLAAIRKRHLIISNLRTVESRHWVSLVQPITSGNTVRYLLTLDIEARNISEIINAEFQSNRWLIGVVGTDGIIISRTWKPEEYVGHKATETYLKGAQGEAGTFYNITLEKAEVLNTYVRSNLSDWTFVAAIPVAELYAPVKRSALVLFGLLAAGAALSILLSFIYGRLFLKPAASLLELSALSSLSHEGSPTTGVKEYDQIAKKISSSLDAIQKQNKERAMLIDELNHRGRNMLTAIQSIAFQS